MCTKISIQTNPTNVKQHFQAAHKSLKIPSISEMMTAASNQKSMKNCNRDEKGPNSSNETQSNIYFKPDPDFQDTFKKREIVPSSELLIHPKYVANRKEIENEKVIDILVRPILSRNVLKIFSLDDIEDGISVSVFWKEDMT